MENKLPMKQYRIKSTVQPDDGGVLRPILVVSEQTLSDYSMHLRHTLVGLADESISVGLICPRDSNIDLLVPPPIEVIRHPVFELPLLWRQSRKVLFERLEKFGPTILHCLCEGKAGFTRWLSQHLGLPYVLTVNSLQERWRKLSVSAGRCVKIIVPAESIAKSIVKRYPKLKERVEQVNVGTFVDENTSCFNAQGELANMVTPYLVREQKGFAYLLEAVRHLSLDGYGIMLVIISEGRAEKQLRRLLAGPEFTQIVTVVPKLEPCRSLLSAGDIFIRAVPRDNFEPLLLEAMSVGSAVAACRGGTDDLIIEGQTAAVFEAGNERSIYDTLRGLLEKREAARRLGRSAQKYLQENHKVSNMVSSILRIYREAQEIFGKTAGKDL